jgi:hypothetical protein
LSSNNRNRRWTVGVAFAAALIGLANTPAAEAEGPFEDLFGDSGFNSWTPAADASLLSSDPTLAATLDTSVQHFIENVAAADPITTLVSEADPSAFTFNDETFIDGPGGTTLWPAVPIGTIADCTYGCDFVTVPIPQDSIGDIAVGLDYLGYLGGLDTFGNPLDFVSLAEFDLVFYPLLALGVLLGI